VENFSIDPQNLNNGYKRVTKNEYENTPLSLFALSILRQVQNNTATGSALKIELLRIKDKDEI
jgi:hypothetical protein